MYAGLASKFIFCFHLVLQTEQFIVMWLLFILIVFGNSAVLAALLLDRTRAKSRMNFFIMHLAIAGKNKEIVAKKASNCLS